MADNNSDDSLPMLYTSRLLLRAFSTDDASLVEHYCGDREVAATTANISHPYPVGGGEQWILTLEAGYLAGLSAVFAITLRDTVELIGACGLTHTREHQRAELGYWIGRPFWGNGYATEAARAVIDWGFRFWSLNRIHAHYMAHNPASGRVMAKLGMHYEGTLRQHQIKWDKPVDVVCHGMLREEWQAGMK